MRDDSGEGYSLFANGPNPYDDVYLFIDRDLSPDLLDQISFVAEYGSEGFAGNIRFRNTALELCVQIEPPFPEEGVLSYPFLLPCDDSVPEQVSDRWMPAIGMGRN